MTDPKPSNWEAPIRFLSEDDALRLTPTGRPFAEEALTFDPGPCSRCGRTPDDGATSGELHDAYIDGGVLRGRSVCSDCVGEED